MPSNIAQLCENPLGKPHRSFSLVDHKVAETEFFLECVRGCCFEFFQVRSYSSAHISSARSITFSLQAVLADAPGFPGWYSEHQQALRSIARFFHEFQTVNQHIGDNLVSNGTSGKNVGVKCFFTPSPEVPNVPEE